ncbi:hypothetical protein TNCV_2040471 [Trichonephila clavipes]|nr:hypothetical protein TNCV_2040471 [Trichonephila clavipes]
MYKSKIERRKSARTAYGLTGCRRSSPYGVRANQNKSLRRPPDSPERLGACLELVDSSLLAEDCDRSGTATSVDGTLYGR